MLNGFIVSYLEFLLFQVYDTGDNNSFNICKICFLCQRHAYGRTMGKKGSLHFLLGTCSGLAALVYVSMLLYCNFHVSHLSVLVVFLAMSVCAYDSHIFPMTYPDDMSV